MLSPAPGLTPEIAALLSRAMFPDPARIARALEAYCTEPDHAIFVWAVKGRVVSAAGVQVAGAEAEVRHIGTRPDCAGQGHGRALLRAIAAHLIPIPFVSCRNRDSSDFHTPRPESVFLLLASLGFPVVFNTFQSESV